MSKDKKPKLDTLPERLRKRFEVKEISHDAEFENLREWAQREPEAFAAWKEKFKQGR